ncbi:MAG: squalene/phytoene synthase family protein [Pseudomonadota bacterium]
MTRNDGSELSDLALGVEPRRAFAGSPPTPRSTLTGAGDGPPVDPEEAALTPIAAEAGASSPSPEAVASNIVARSKTSFSAGMRILPPPRRRAMYAVYAFSRIIDDIADGAFAEARKRAMLDAWRSEVSAAYAGRPASAVGAELAWARARFDLPEAEFQALIDGMAMDAGAPIVAPDMATFRLYTRRVAGAVGLLSMRCFGAWVGEPSERFALALGDALQFTNILRDVEEDAEMGRLYLPREVLTAHGAPLDDPSAVAQHPKLQDICRALGHMAAARFQDARREIPAHRRGRLAPALMMMGAYEGYLNRMISVDFRRDGGPVTLSGLQKLGLGLRYALAPPMARPLVTESPLATTAPGASASSAAQAQDKA